MTEDTQTIDGVAYVTGFAYDTLDRPTAMTYPADGGGNRETVSFGYNGRTLLYSVGSYVASLTYNALGKPLTLANGAGGTTNYAYNPNHFRLSALGFSGTGTTFGYDEIDRLTSASGGCSAGYRYDLLGNLASKGEGGTTRSLSNVLTIHPDHLGGLAPTMQGTAVVADLAFFPFGGSRLEAPAKRRCVRLLTVT